MAAPHESPSSLHGHPWSVWAEKIGRDSPLSDDQNVASKQVDSARLAKNEMDLYGECPGRDQLLLVVCQHCNMAVKPQSLMHHIDIRHPEVLAPPPPPAKPVIEVPEVKPAKAPNIKPPPQKFEDLRKSKSASKLKNEKRPPVLSSVNSVMPVPFDKIPSPQQPPPLPSPTYGGAVKPVLTTPSPLTSPQQANTMTVTVSMDAGGSQMVQIHLPELSPPILQPMIEPSSDQNVQFSSKKRKKSSTDKKNVPLRDREFNPDIHCGVWIADDRRNCTRSLTCKSHTLSARRAVPGRSKRYDELLAEHKATKEQGKSVPASIPKPSSPPVVNMAKAALTRKLAESVQARNVQRPQQSALAASVPILARSLTSGLNMVEESYPPTISLPATDSGDSDFPQLLNELKIEVPGLTDGDYDVFGEIDLCEYNKKPLVAVKADLRKALSEDREPVTKFTTERLKPLGTCPFTLRREGNMSLPSWKYKRLRNRFATAGEAAKQHYSYYQSQQALAQSADQSYSSSYVPDHSLSNFSIGDPYAQFTDISDLTDEQLFNGDDSSDILSQALSASNVLPRSQPQQYSVYRQVKQEPIKQEVRHEFMVKEERADYASVKREVNAPSLNHDRSPKRMRPDLNPQRNGVIQNDLILQALIGSTSNSRAKMELFERSSKNAVQQKPVQVQQSQQLLNRLQPQQQATFRRVQPNVQIQELQSPNMNPVQIIMNSAQSQNLTAAQSQGIKVARLQGINPGQSVNAVQSRSVQSQNLNMPGLTPIQGVNMQTSVKTILEHSGVTQNVQSGLRTQGGTHFQVVPQVRQRIQSGSSRSDDFGLDWQSLAPSINTDNQVTSNGHLDLDDSALLNDILSENFPDLGNLDFADDLLGLDEPIPVSQAPSVPQRVLAGQQTPTGSIDTRTKVVIERRQSNPVQTSIASSALSQYGLSSPPSSVPTLQRQNSIGLNTGVACLSSPPSTLQQSPLTYQQIFNDQVINQIRLQPRSPTESAVLRILQSPAQRITPLTHQRQDAGKS